MNRFFIFVCASLLIFFAHTARCGQQTAASTDEIQVLIDVSGSMKLNDPQNQRVAATKLLINLLPDTCKAAIWLFAEKTVELQPRGFAGADWKKAASKAAAGIQSNGLYTDIETAIKTALKRGFNENGNKHLILLTDGIVDISKDIMVSADSRERILSEWIPALQQQNIKVDTIALSEQADKDLLYKLAFDTGGWTETAESAEQLQRVFLKMLLRAAPKENLPLIDNRFNVDNSVKEFSVLVFKKSGSAASKLVTPERKIIDKNSAPANIAWLETPVYDLVTVNKPAGGEWRLDADTDPDNQVMIMTDLKLQTMDLPSFINQAESLSIQAYFTEKNQLITKKDFLQLITGATTLDQQPADNWPVPDQSGYFNRQLKDLRPGKHQLIIRADGKTFKREIAREFTVVAEMIRVETHADADKRAVTVNLLPDSALIDTASLVISANISQAGQTPVARIIPAENGQWSLALNDLPAGAETLINFDIQARSPEGKPITVALKPLRINDAFFNPATLPAAGHTEPDEATADHEQPPADKADSEESEPASAEAEDAEKELDMDGWLKVAGIVASVNILLLAGGYFLSKTLKKNRLAKQAQILTRLT
ncbi:MAG: vWA domain-containing protein [Methylomonas sp.]|jgi:hypothetical protein